MLKRIKLYSLSLLLSISFVQLNAVLSDLERQFLTDAENNNIEGVKEALNKNVNVNVQNESGRPALYFAAMRPNKQMVELLLNDPKMDVNTPSNLSIDPISAPWVDLLYKIKKMKKEDPAVYQEILKLIMNHSSMQTNINGKLYGRSTLLFATFTGNTEIVELLLKHPDINIDYRYGFNEGGTSLYYAIKGGRQDIANMLIKKGARRSKQFMIKAFLAGLATPMLNGNTTQWLTPFLFGGVALKSSYNTGNQANLGNKYALEGTLAYAGGFMARKLLEKGIERYIPRITAWNHAYGTKNPIIAGTVGLLSLAALYRTKTKIV